MPQPFIVGKKVNFCAIEEEDFTERLIRWRNDPEITYFLVQGLLPSSRELLKEEYEHLIRSKNDVVFAIVDKQTGTRVGITGYYRIDWIARTGELRIIIGEKEYWSKGYGTEATKLTVQYGFDKLNLNRVWLGVTAENKGAIKSYENAGFVHEGILRQEIYNNGKYYDAIRMSILRSEYLSRKE